MALFATVHDLEKDADIIRSRAYGMIEVTDGKF